jgi:uncharacterized protein YyaL (SSP411 family)
VPNRLAAATSPYLLQHADNPVDWREWGEEAFAEARERGVPVLVSVGYAACHWCHVPVKSARPVRMRRASASSQVRCALLARGEPR